LAAWTDDEDAEEHVNIVRSARSRKLRREVEETSVTGDVFQERLRAQHGKGQKSGTPKWAQLPSEEDSPQDPTLDMLKSTSRLVGTKNIGLLEPDRIRIGTMTDANKSGVSKAVVQVIRWHPNGSILMTAGFDKTIRLFDIDGLKNTRLQSAHFNDLPISSAQFSHSGNEIYLAGLHHSFYVYDILSAKIDRVDRIMGTKEEEFKMMLCGPHADSYIVFLGGKGQIHVVSPKTKKWVTTMKMNGSVKVAVFDKEGRLWTAGGRGEVYIWDMKSFTCLRRFSDEGGGRITAMSMSPTGEFFATGQDSGVVNVYNISDPESSFHKSSNPTPTKSILNLTTKITNIEFNHDGQILAIASSTLRNQMRLIHVPTFRVFQNWPTEKTPIGRVSALSFSPEGNWLAVGNVRGACKLFKLHHYHPSSRK
jgi:U3 small nucleolar RNA-associated protein 18